MAKFYTGTGDDGTTGLLGEGRVEKYHPIPEAIGSLDEATAALGMARAVCQADLTAEILLTVQRDLYHMMAELAATPENALRFRKIDPQRVIWLEDTIDEISKVVDTPGEFILPGDTAAGAVMALARTIVRRAERCLAQLSQEGLVENIEVLRYLNRLSSLCFVLELLENQAQGKAKPTLAKNR